MKIRKITKRGSLLHQVIAHVVLIGLIFGMFFMATIMRVNSRYTKQQILERQTALLIDASSPGMDIQVYKYNKNGKINNLALSNGNVLVEVEGLKPGKGYPYFSRYDVSIEETDVKYIIHVK